MVKDEDEKKKLHDALKQKASQNQIQKPVILAKGTFEATAEKKTKT